VPTGHIGKNAGKDMIEKLEGVGPWGMKKMLNESEKCLQGRERKGGGGGNRGGFVLPREGVGQNEWGAVGGGGGLVKVRGGETKTKKKKKKQDAGGGKRTVVVPPEWGTLWRKRGDLERLGGCRVGGAPAGKKKKKTGVGDMGSRPGSDQVTSGEKEDLGVMEGTEGDQWPHGKKECGGDWCPLKNAFIWGKGGSEGNKEPCGAGNRRGEEDDFGARPLQGRKSLGKNQEGGGAQGYPFFKRRIEKTGSQPSTFKRDRQGRGSNGEAGSLWVGVQLVGGGDKNTTTWFYVKKGGV